MNSEASDDLLTRVRAYLSGLEPDGIPADDLTDDEVADLVLMALESMDERRLWLLTPGRMRPRVSIGFPVRAEVDQEGRTARLIGDSFTEGLEFGTDRPVRGRWLRRALADAAPRIAGILARDVTSDPTPD
jgi:hypothetical protein